MTRFLLWLLARSLVLTAEQFARLVGVTAEGYVYLHAGQWCVAPGRGHHQTLTLGGLFPSSVTVTRLVRVGPVVLAREWTPDGGPCVYVLAASEECEPSPEHRGDL